MPDHTADDLDTALADLDTFHTHFARIHARSERTWSRTADSANATHAASVIAQSRRRESVEVFRRHVLPHADRLIRAAHSAVAAMPPARHHTAWRGLIDDLGHAIGKIRSILTAPVPARRAESDATGTRDVRLWPYVLAWAERSFIISNLAKQHRPTAPPLSGEEQQRWTERALAAWQRGGLEVTDVWYSARNELISLAYLIEDDEQKVLVLVGGVGSEQMRVLGHHTGIAEAERAAPPPVPAGVLRPNFAPFQHRPSTTPVPVAELLRRVEDAQHTREVYMALLDAVEDSGHSRGLLPRLSELLARAATFADALETGQGQQTAARLTVLARQLDILTTEIESAATGLGCGVLPPHRTPHPIFHLPAPPTATPPSGPATPHTSPSARRL
ncbi:hypothetical protein GPA10_37490 [Streptomyces sp. p1417]|uniref:Uncharacterized protein n=1 Tax=Streptomyces typhae TaxID=2681492 RepID=A0A6L6X8P6_9ACTN|nr:hypothetical protein [Streptomyces typhae]MVO90295.1 hypothetical protein [Streptomyces typhae]